MTGELDWITEFKAKQEAEEINKKKKVPRQYSPAHFFFHIHTMKQNALTKMEGKEAMACFKHFSLVPQPFFQSFYRQSLVFHMQINILFNPLPQNDKFRVTEKLHF